MKYFINNKKESGFTIVELVVVLAGITALGSFAIPNILNQIKLSKAEEVKALMNSYAADCLGKYRTSATNADFKKKKPTIDTGKLDNLGYKIDGETQCNKFSIKPKNEKEKFFYGLGFEIIDGEVIKTATSTGSNESALSSCKNWGGCGMTDEQKAALAKKRATQKRYEKCEETYINWEKKARLANSDLPGTGYKWSSQEEKCNIQKWAYDGKIGSSLPWYDAEIEKAIGKKCNDWRQRRIAKKELTDSTKKPKGETDPSGNCKEKKYWFTLDQAFTSKSAWEKQVTADALNLCNADINKYREKKHNKPEVIKPANGPLPCGTRLYFCNGIPANTKAEWDLTQCGIDAKKAEAEAERKRQEEAKKRALDKNKPLPPANIPKTVPGNRPGQTVKCKTPMPYECKSKKWRRLIPDCKCWYPNG